MKKVIIMGAGPAGLSAAAELVNHLGFEVVIYELENSVGGLSRTLDYNGNNIDIGPHRFFTKSDYVLNYWKSILQFEESEESCLLTKNRLTRIHFLNKFFDYPIKLSFKTLMNLGFMRILKIALSYLKVLFFPIKEEKNLEDFFINRFGRELYLTFFKDYTEKVWGIPVTEIKPDWGAQRIKGVSILKTLEHAIKSSFKLNYSKENIETSLVEQFYYPKFGAGMMWEQMQSEIVSKGGKVCTNKQVISIKNDNEKIEEIIIKDTKTGEITIVEADYFISSIPIVDLINGMSYKPENVSYIANNLKYRDMLILGLLFKGFKSEILLDNWIYLQDSNIKAGRLEIYNNFSHEMLKDKNTVWLGMEYFCNKGDELWSKSDLDLINMGISELSKMQFFNKEDFIEGTVYRIEKAYPAYFGVYERFNEIRDFTDTIKNLFLIGRNGMHKYNNMDHSMICGFEAARTIINNTEDKSSIWNVNLEKEYHETKQG